AKATWISPGSWRRASPSRSSPSGPPGRLVLPDTWPTRSARWPRSGRRWTAPPGGSGPSAPARSWTGWYRERGWWGGSSPSEGGESLQGSLGRVEIFHRLGVRALGLTWNHRNELADGCLDPEAGGGLTRFGREVVRACEARGWVLDVSHLSERGFWDLMETAQGPVIASHSNAHAVHPHPRNLRDEQLVALAQKGGVVGLNFYPGFLTHEARGTLQDLVRHAVHIAQVIGPEHLGLGSDFDGISQTPEDLPDVTALPRLTAALLEAGFSEEETRGILGGNFRRIFQSVLPVAEEPSL